MLLDRLKGIGRRRSAAHELREEYRFLFKPLPHLIEGWNKDLVNNLVGIPVLQKCLCALIGLILQSAQQNFIKR